MMDMRKNELLQNPLPELNRQERRAVNKKVNGSKTPSSVRNVFIRVSRVNVAKEDNPKLGIKAGDTVIYETEDIYNILSEWEKTKKGITYYFIKHDKDGATEGENVHYHIVICFDNATVFNQIKARFPYGQISKCIYGVHKTVQYLVHANHPTKYQYSWDEVITNNYIKLEDFKVPYKKSMQVRLEETIQDIINGEIKEFEIDKIDSDLYIKKKKYIRNAFEYREKLLLKDQHRSIKIIGIVGPPRVGKTTFVKCLAKEMGRSLCLSSASNDPWCTYGGQDIFCLDDADFEQIRIDDMKKMIDPLNNTGVKSRYYNKFFIGDVIVVISNTPFCDWYFDAKTRDRQALLERFDCILDFEESLNSHIENVALFTRNKYVTKEDNGGYDTYYKNNGDKYGRQYKKLQYISLDNGRVHEFDMNQYINFEERKTEVAAFLDALLNL